MNLERVHTRKVSKLINSISRPVTRDTDLLSFIMVFVFEQDIYFVTPQEKNFNWSKEFCVQNYTTIQVIQLADRTRT